jgi:hypothetical protein
MEVDAGMMGIMTMLLAHHGEFVIEMGPGSEWIGSL